MFFDDKKFNKKVDLGNKKVVSKEQFMKKIKEDKVKETEKQKTSEKNKILSNFFNKLRTKIISENTISDLLKNLKSVLSLFALKKDLDEIQKETIIQNALNKIFPDLEKISKSFISIQKSNELINTIVELLSYLSPETIAKLFEQR